MKNILRWFLPRVYVVRCSAGRNMLVLTWFGALHEMKLSGPDASVYTLGGTWVAGRRVLA